MALLDQRQVSTTADLEGHKSPRNEEGRVIQSIRVSEFIII